MSLFANEVEFTAPAWASFFSMEQYAQFLGHVHDYLREHEIVASVEDGMVSIPSDNQKLGLQNLAQICFHSPQIHWRERVFNHLQRVRDSSNTDEILAHTNASFHEIADKLAIRLWPKAMLAVTNSAELVTREYIPDVVAVLVVDNPDSISTVGWSVVQNWELPIDFVFERALANVQQGAPPKLTKIMLDDQLAITVFLSDSFFMTTSALFLDQFRDCIGTFGTLVGIPHRHALLCFPINDESILDVLSNMVIAVYNMHSEGPGSISPFLYWYTGEEYIQLPYAIDDNQMTFLPPQAFVDLLETISQAN